ncbi:MAG: tetratricopeptide repeat protein [Chitinophagales bacterium]|nr:tetratricopeptide repeat protein [Chitinophagales bacterium]
MNTKRIEQLNSFLKQNPGDSFVKFALALEYINGGDNDKALEYFKDILRHDPDYTGLYYHLGKLYEKLNMLEEAEETYKEGLWRTSGKDVHAHRELEEAINQLTIE